MCALLFHLQRLDSLAKQLETILFKCVVDACSPLHFAAPAHQVYIVFLEAVDSITTRFLGRCAGTIGRTQ